MSMAKKILLWIIMFPVALLVSVLFRTLIMSLNNFDFWGHELISNYITNIIGAGALGFSFVLTTKAIAPNHKIIVGYISATLMTIVQIISSIFIVTTSLEVEDTHTAIISVINCVVCSLNCFFTAYNNGD